MADFFQEDESLRESIQVAEPLPGKELDQLFTRLEGIENPDHISTVVVEQLVSLLAGRVCIDGTEDKIQGAHLFYQILPCLGGIPREESQNQSKSRSLLCNF
ncbi:hypothetical protein Mapa_012272 [Marchantia paleacea]|nr:hypothetical protein Mapa_012272 [Marchantia paleacea]